MVSLNELLNRSSSLTIAELLSNALNEGLNYAYSEMKLKLKRKYFSELELQFDSNLVKIILIIKSTVYSHKRSFFF